VSDSSEQLIRLLISVSWGLAGHLVIPFFHW